MTRYADSRSSSFKPTQRKHPFLSIYFLTSCVVHCCWSILDMYPAFAWIFIRSSSSLDRSRCLLGLPDPNIPMYIEDVKTFRGIDRRYMVYYLKSNKHSKKYPQTFEEGCTTKKRIVSTPQALTTP